MHKEGTAMQFERNSLAALRRTSILIAILLVVPVVVSGILAAATREKTLYQFQGGSDGWFPAASMIAGKNGNLYGATMEDGTTKHCEGQGAGGCGTIFQLAPPTRSGGMWTETVLYRFHGGKEDGAFPASPMIFDADGNLYGATSGGGLQQGCTSGCGTVFELSPPSTPGAGWTETILHLFKGVPSGRGDGDAANPNNVVLGSDGNIYGTAYSGGHCVTDETGTYCYGAVFELKRPANPNGAWTEKLLSIFRGPTGAPQGAILDKTGNLYGTAVWGAYGFGEVFQLVPAAHGFWTRNNIYSFHDAPDGAFPVNGLAMDSAGNLYGATLGGGNGVPGLGTLFELQPPPNQGGAWTESVLYAFGTGSDGNSPATGPILDGAGNIYGATDGGGMHNFGTVFKLKRGSAGVWTEKILYSFLGRANGAAPYGGLNFGKFGALYGTTPTGGTLGAGGCAIDGCGTIFRVAP
jgi:uncharacterized repeat protein (TIGR03803 family)